MKEINFRNCKWIEIVEEYPDRPHKYLCHLTVDPKFVNKEVCCKCKHFEECSPENPSN